MTAKIKIPFNALPERTRARFVAATTQPPGGQEVAPVLAEKTMKVGAYILWTIVLLVVSVILLGLISSRFGSVYEPRAPIENLLGYMLGFFMLASERRGRDAQLLLADLGIPGRHHALLVR